MTLARCIYTPSGTLQIGDHPPWRPANRRSNPHRWELSPLGKRTSEEATGFRATEQGGLYPHAGLTPGNGNADLPAEYDLIEATLHGGPYTPGDTYGVLLEHMA